jgi:hypothetical protein
MRRLRARRRREETNNPMTLDDLAKLANFLQETKDKAANMAMAIGNGDPL